MWYHVSMKKSLIYLIIALFLAFVVQPNINSKLTKGNQRVPKNAHNGAVITNENVEYKTDVKDTTICLDAANNTNENSDVDINLELTEKIGQALKNVGFKVVYTRSSDTTLTNTERMQIASKAKADYLLSITTNSDTDGLQRGYSIMTQENKKLISLSNTISNQLDAINYTVYQGLDTDHYANFPILTNAKVPAILIEVGYTSNDTDLSNLSNDLTQNKIAEAITKAFVIAQK